MSLRGAQRDPGIVSTEMDEAVMSRYMGESLKVSCWKWGREMNGTQVGPERTMRP